MRQQQLLLTSKVAVEHDYVLALLIRFRLLVLSTAMGRVVVEMSVVYISLWHWTLPDCDVWLSCVDERA